PLRVALQGSMEAGGCGYYSTGPIVAIWRAPAGRIKNGRGIGRLGGDVIVVLREAVPKLFCRANRGSRIRVHRHAKSAPLFRCFATPFGSVASAGQATAVWNAKGAFGRYRVSSQLK
ncbi:MAG TPA: hypothetical protein VHU42_13585, partial [Rhodopila sp.]|nr:hypothetical protein [Rhodopila sp.]